MENDSTYVVVHAERQEEGCRELHEKGLPIMQEAIESGMMLAQWNKMLEDAGAWKK